jgi:hypothetical protein
MSVITPSTTKWNFTYVESVYWTISYKTGSCTATISDYVQYITKHIKHTKHTNIHSIGMFATGVCVLRPVPRYCTSISLICTSTRVVDLQQLSCLINFISSEYKKCMKESASCVSRKSKMVRSPGKLKNYYTYCSGTT